MCDRVRHFISNMGSTLMALEKTFSYFYININSGVQTHLRTCIEQMWSVEKMPTIKHDATYVK